MAMQTQRELARIAPVASPALKERTDDVLAYLDGVDGCFTVERT